MASRSPHNGGDGLAKVQAGIAAALALSYNKLRKLGFTHVESRRLLLKICREAIKEL
jgi:hypothetical protein